MARPKYKTFDIIPQKSITRNKDLDVYQKAILNVIMSYAGSKDEAFPSIPTIRYCTGLCEKTIHVKMKGLLEEGYFQKRQKIMSSGSCQKRHRNIYRITWERFIEDLE